MVVYTYVHACWWLCARLVFVRLLCACTRRYATFSALAGVVDNPRDAGEGRFPVDGVNLWPYLSGDTPTFGTLRCGTLRFNFFTCNACVSGRECGCLIT